MRIEEVDVKIILTLLEGDKNWKYEIKNSSNIVAVFLQGFL